MDNLVLAMFMPISLDDLNEATGILSCKHREIFHDLLGQRHFFTSQDLKDCCAFLRKALSHQSEKLKTAFVRFSLQNVAI